MGVTKAVAQRSHGRSSIAARRCIGSLPATSPAPPFCTAPPSWLFEPMFTAPGRNLWNDSILVRPSHGVVMSAEYKAILLMNCAKYEDCKDVHRASLLLQQLRPQTEGFSIQVSGFRPICHRADVAAHKNGSVRCQR